MYITTNMANLQKCSRCKSEIDISYFGLNRKKQPYKTCVNCRSKVKRPCTQLKRTDTDFVDGVKEIEPAKEKQVLICSDDEPRDCLIGEDRQFGGNVLYKDLIPNTTWFNNVRSCVSRSSWDKLRKQVYERVDYKCECCNTDCKKKNLVSRRRLCSR